MPDVNIVQDYSWTSIPRDAPLRDEAPMAIVRAIKPKFSQLQQFVSGYTNILSTLNDGDDFYKKLYNGVKINNFYFPYFNDNVRSFYNEYSDTFSAISQRGASFAGSNVLQQGANVAEELVGAAALGREIKNSNITQSFRKIDVDPPGTIPQVPGAPGSYIETPKFYQYSNTDAPLQISFILANTIEPDDVDKNYKFITDFIRINRPERKGSIAVTFPAIYKIEVPGIRYIEWAACSLLSIQLLGTRRLINNRVIPEAYKCEFSFTSLTIEPANFIGKGLKP